jgi:hypothetical protein
MKQNEAKKRENIKFFGFSKTSETEEEYPASLPFHLKGTKFKTKNIGSEKVQKKNILSENLRTRAVSFFFN